MIVSPNIKKYPPKYPKIKEIKDISVFLKNRKPKRWKKNSVLIGVSLGLITSTYLSDNPYTMLSLFAKDSTIKTIPPFMGKIAVSPSHISESDSKELIENYQKYEILTKNVIIKDFDNSLTYVEKEIFDEIIRTYSNKISKKSKQIFVYYIENNRYKLEFSICNYNKTYYCSLNLLKINDLTNLKSNLNKELFVFSKVESKKNNFQQVIESKMKIFIKKFKNKQSK
jgi:hypothetical protein